MYQHGRHVKRDEKKAEEYFAKGKSLVKKPTFKLGSSSELIQSSYFRSKKWIFDMFWCQYNIILIIIFYQIRSRVFWWDLCWFSGTYPRGKFPWCAPSYLPSWSEFSGITTKSIAICLWHSDRRAEWESHFPAVSWSKTQNYPLKLHLQVYD